MKNYIKPDTKAVDTTIENPFAAGGYNTVGYGPQAKGTDNWEPEEDDAPDSDW
ncbi:MAG: hypothetical protein LUC26_00220 [Prevotella sp.]|nr:hypothetical protein [Prevotella sp.]